MNEQLQQTLAEILNVLKTAAEKAGSVAQEQLPLLVQEYLAWGFWSNLLLGLACLTVPLIFLYCVRVVIRTNWENDLSSTKGMVFILLGFASGVASMAAAIPVGIQSFGTALQVAIAPRVYLLEQVVEIMK